MSRLHLLSYPVAPRDKKKETKPHQLRDLSAGHELSSALQELGFRRGMQIFNQAPRHAPVPPPKGVKPYHVDLSFVAEDDALLHFTRPPMSDTHSGNLRKIAQAHTDLELLLFEAWKPFLPTCARDHVELHDDLHGLVRPGFEHCREMSFEQKGWGAPYYKVNAKEGEGWRRCRGQRKSALFLLRLEHAWPGGPGYICAFGMSGCTTLIWAYRLAHEFRHLLQRPGFVIAELELGALPEHLTDLRFCESWRIELALVHEFSTEPALV